MSSGESAPEVVTVVVPAELTLASIDDARRHLLERLGHATNLAIDAGAVHSIDGAGLQLLVALAREVQYRGSPLRWVGASKAVVDIAAELGARRLLGLPDGAR